MTLRVAAIRLLRQTRLLGSHLGLRVASLAAPAIAALQAAVALLEAGGSPLAATLPCSCAAKFFEAACSRTRAFPTNDNPS